MPQDGAMREKEAVIRQFVRSEREGRPAGSAIFC